MENREAINIEVCHHFSLDNTFLWWLNNLFFDCVKVLSLNTTNADLHIWLSWKGIIHYGNRLLECSKQPWYLMSKWFLIAWKSMKGKSGTIYFSVVYSALQVADFLDILGRSPRNCASNPIYILSSDEVHDVWEQLWFGKSFISTGTSGDKLDNMVDITCKRFSISCHKIPATALFPIRARVKCKGKMLAPRKANRIYDGYNPDHACNHPLSC
jgi:hypothetical protein